MSKFWVIQDDLFRENGRDVLVNTLERFSIPYQIVKVVPVSHELIPEITQTENIITNGSVLLSKIAWERGWTPGGFFNTNFDYRVWFPIFKQYLLNNNATFTTVENAKIVLHQDVFVRPVLDDKCFDGKVMRPDEFVEWQSQIIQGKRKYIKPQTEIIISVPKKIGQEHRHFIVGGEVVTSSRYKLNNKVNYAEGADSRVIDFVKQMINIWTPAEAFVLDTYMTGDEIGIVEIGCIANAGFYAADIQKLIMALDQL